MDKKKAVIPDEVLKQFGFQPDAISIVPVQQGLINYTWKIETGAQAFILQKINHEVFNRPEDVDFNVASIAEYLAKYFPGYIFTSPLKTIDGHTIWQHSNDHYYRLFAFIEGSVTMNNVATPKQAYEAARQFGKFTALLKNFDASDLRITIPSFHDLGLRYRQFLASLENGNIERREKSASLIKILKQHSFIVDHFEKIKKDPQFRLRVIHHDTKISNVLFDKHDTGICVIDLDTVMPGYFISDVGDMMRTYLCAATEEEQDTSKLNIRPEIYNAIVQGYLDEMEEELSEYEKEHFFYAGCFMMYMQALRFLTDYLNNDIYYGATHEAHNYNRANNQLVLLQQFMALKEVLQPAPDGLRLTQHKF